MLVLLILAALLVAAVSTIYLYVYKPGQLARWFLDLVQYRSGLRRRFAQIGKYRYCYAERGQKREGSSTLVLVHGFSASQHMFSGIVKKIPQNMHIIVPDLLGHGRTEGLAKEDDINVDILVESLHQLVDGVGVNSYPMHLAGTSMGGIVAMFYATRYPSEVDRLSLICPGIVTPKQTKFMQEVQEGKKCRLIPQNPVEMLEMIHMCLYHKVKIPNVFVRGFLALRKPKEAFYRKLFESLKNSIKDQEEYAMNGIKKVVMPTQIIWGKHDEVVHVSGAELLKSLLPNCQRVDLLDKCGHSIDLERPGLLVKCLMEFREQQANKKED